MCMVCPCIQLKGIDRKQKIKMQPKPNIHQLISSGTSPQQHNDVAKNNGRKFVLEVVFPKNRRRSLHPGAGDEMSLG